ncbi:hypothetical protein V2J09_015882 [Rumex salicifolius]
MDLEEWEFLSDDGFIDQLQAQEGRNKRANSRENLPLHSNSMIDMNYFQKFIDPPPNLVIPVPVEFDLSTPVLSKSSLLDDLVVKEVVSPEIPVVEGENDAVSSQVFFKKIGENEFADMKLDSPKSTNKGFVPQIDLGNPQFEEKMEGFDVPIEEKKMVDSSDEQAFDCKEEKLSENGNDNHGGLNIWKMGMTGIGALCSFGFACATICVIAISCRHRERQQDQKLHFQIYTDDKRIKQVVHHAAKLNEAISAVRGASVSRAHITIGGYFEGL